MYMTEIIHVHDKIIHVHDRNRLAANKQLFLYRLSTGYLITKAIMLLWSAEWLREKVISDLDTGMPG